MAVQYDRRLGDRRMEVIPGGRGRGPGTVIVLRSQMVENLMEEMTSWGDVATAARKIADYADAKQARAFRRVKSWDGGPDAA